MAHGHGLDILSLGGGALEPPRLIWSYSVEEMSRTVKGGFSIVSLAGNGPFLGEVYRECRGTAMDRPLIPPGTDSIWFCANGLSLESHTPVPYLHLTGQVLGI